MQEEGLRDIGEIVEGDSRGKFEAYDTQMEAVRIDAQPVGSILLTTRLVELHGVGLHTATTEVVVAIGILRGISLGISERMPSPVGLRTQGDTFGVVRWEGLQAGSVDRHGKATIAHREGRQRVETMDNGIVALQQCLAVNLSLCPLNEEAEERQKQYTDSHGQ